MAEPRPWADARAWVGVGVLVLAALALRLIITRGIWVDEAISIHQAQMPLHSMLNDLQRTDRHPPLHYLLLWLVVRAFGTGELAVRAPSIVAGTALVPALFVCGRDMFDRRTGLLAATLGATAPLIVWYSQEARMYALVMLFATLATWGQVRAIRSGRPRDWVWYAGASIALVWTHYFGLIIVALQQLAFAAVAWRRVRQGRPVAPLLTGCWITSAAIVLAILPLVPFAYHQFTVSETTGTGFASVPSQAAPSAPAESPLSVYTFLSNLVWAVWGYHGDATMLRIAALWPLLMLAALALLGRGRSPRTAYLLALALFPPLALLGLGFAKRDLFEVRYFIGAVPIMMLLLARTISAACTRRVTMALASAALVGTLLVGYGDEEFNANNPRAYDFRGALQQIASRARPGDVLLYAPDYLRDVVAYYGPRLNAQPLTPSAVNTPAGGHRVFLLASFLDDPKLASRVGQAVYQLRRDHGLLAHQDRRKIRTWLFGGARSRASRPKQAAHPAPRAAHPTRRAAPAQSTPRADPAHGPPPRRPSNRRPPRTPGG